MPWGRQVDREIVGTIKKFEPVDIIIEGGGAIMAAAGGEWVIDADDKPGESVKFRGFLCDCPADPPGKTDYLIQLVRYDKPVDDVLWWMTACTSIDPATSSDFRRQSLNAATCSLVASSAPSGDHSFSS